MDWLFETKISVVIILGLAAAFAVVLWSRSRDRATMIGAGVAVLALLVYVLLGQFVESDREKAKQSLLQIAEQYNANNLDGLMEHVADDFQGASGLSKSALRQYAERGKQLGANEVLFFDVKVENYDQKLGKATLHFAAKPKGSNVPEVPYQIESDFVRGSDGQWRMKSLKVFKFGTTEEVPLP